MGVFDFTNSQEFLRHWLEEQKKNGRKLSFELIARQLGLRSKGHAYRLFHDPNSPITARLALRVVEMVPLMGDERAYFEAMVGFNRSESLDERRLFLARMGKLAGKSGAQKLKPEACAYLSEWYLPVLREAVTMPSFRGDYRKLAREFVPALTEAQIRRGVQLLRDLQLIKAHASGGFAISETFVHAGDDIQSVLVATFQQTMMRMASEALERESPEQREISTLTFSFPASRFASIQKALRKMQQDLAEEILKEQAPSDTVYQFNLQCFPVYHCDLAQQTS